AAVWTVGASTASTGGSQIPLAGTGSPQTGDFTPSGAGDVTTVEFPGQEEGEQGPGAFNGTIVDRSLSTGVGNGASVSSGQKAKSTQQFKSGIEGLHF